MTLHIKNVGIVGITLCLLGAVAHAASTAPKEESSSGGKLVIPLHQNEVASYQDVVYQCQDESKKPNDDAQELLTSLPNGGRLKATYIHSDMTALVVLPIDGNVLTFANVEAGSGAKYMADRYSWWTKGDDAIFSRDDKEKVMIVCHVVFENKISTKAKSVKSVLEPQQKK